MAAQDQASHPFHFSWLLILCAFVAWKEPPNSQFPQILGGTPRGVRYASLWDTSSPARKQVNAIVFYEYYLMLQNLIQQSPRISTETVDAYDNRLNFMADSHRIYLRPKRTKRDDWAPGWFRMTMQEVENVIKGFDDQWRNEYEDTTPLPMETDQTGPPEKGKDKLDTQAHQTKEVPPQGKKKRDAPE